MFVQYNPNPTGRFVADCAVRAISKALDIDWETAYAKLAMNGYAMGDMPNANSVIASVLRQNGFKRMNLKADCPECYTIKDFCREYSKGTYLVGTGAHVVGIKDGSYFDSWDSGDESVAYAWVLS